MPWARDDIDRRIIDNIRGGIGRIINSENEAEGYPQSRPVYSRFREGDWDVSNMRKIF